MGRHLPYGKKVWGTNSSEVAAFLGLCTLNFDVMEETKV